MAEEAAKLYSIDNVFSILHEALMPYYSDETVKISYEKNEEPEERRYVPTLEFLMNVVGHQMAERWTSTKEELLKGMHKALDDTGYYGEFTYDIEASIGKFPYKGGSRRKSRKTRKLRH